MDGPLGSATPCRPDRASWFESSRTLFRPLGPLPHRLGNPRGVGAGRETDPTANEPCQLLRRSVQKMRQAVRANPAERQEPERSLSGERKRPDVTVGTGRRVLRPTAVCPHIQVGYGGTEGKPPSAKRPVEGLLSA